MEPLKLWHRQALLLGRNYLLSLGGEAVQSAFHFALNFFLIWALTAYEYGVFAIVFILGGISLTYGNALVSVPAAVHIPKMKSARAINVQDVVFSSFAVAIAALLAVTVALGLWLTIHRPAEAAAGGAFVGLWTLRNHVRITLFSRNATSLATLSDISYSASGAIMIATQFWLVSGVPQVTTVLLALAVANAIGIVFALGSLGAPIRISFRRSVRARYRTIWREIVWSLIGVTTANIQGQAPMFVVAAMVGPAAYAPIAAGMVLFNPLRTAFGAFVNVVRPEFAAGLAQGRLRQVKFTLYSSSAIIVLCCVVFGFVVWLGWPILDAHFYSGKFVTVSMPLIVTLAGLASLIYLSYAVPMSLLQAARTFKPIAVATTMGGIVGTLTVVVLLMFSTVSWALAGSVAGESLCLIYLWIASLRTLGNGQVNPGFAQGSGQIESTVPRVMPAR